ncbi:MAG TPA: hypothetical protein ENN19_07075 [Chloroflexi bacterium]|nr:hypothetical protein [Chloroflexota bacterium]
MSLTKEIERFLLAIPDINKKDFREQLAKDAKLPDNLKKRIEWDKPDQDFVAHLVGRLESWGTFDIDDERYALDEYLKATREHGGGEHKATLNDLLKKLAAERKKSGGSDPKFVNREEEIKELTDECALSSRYAIHAPAGYGKTWLMERLRHEFDNKGWLVFYATLKKDDGPLELSRNLLLYPDLDSASLESNPAAAANLVGGKLKDLWDQGNGQDRKGIVLLIDLSSIPEQISALDTILGQWLQVLTENVLGHQDFARGDNLLRVIVSGRFFDPKRLRSFSEGRLKFQIYPLEPFNDHVVDRSIQDYFPTLEVGRRRELGAGLVHHVGGHPKCMSDILKLYKDSGKPDPNNFFQDHCTEIKGLVDQEVANVLEEIPEPTKQQLLSLSPYRYWSIGLLRDILAEENPIVEWGNGTLELADELTKTSLVSQTDDGYLYRDSISRRIMTLFLCNSECDAETSFSKRCEKARDFYKRRLQDEKDTAPPCRWAIEILYQSLQMHVNEIDSLEGRRNLRRSFWGEDDSSSLSEKSTLYECLSILVGGRDAQEQLGALKHVLKGKDEWEFRFTLNYFLRDETYENRWSDVILPAKIDAFQK